MEKVGYILDEKLKKSTNFNIVNTINKIFARFQELQDDSALPKLSVRIKLLIKNLLENRQQGWQRSL
jgi:hypothetical protein